MILILAKLSCERCETIWPEPAKAQDQLMHRDIEELRSKAQAKGWRRSSGQDLCAACVQALAADGKAVKR